MKVYKEGFVASWNAQSHDPFLVRPGDQIIRVNGKEVSLAMQVNEFTLKGTLHLIVQRNNSPPPFGKGEANGGVRERHHLQHRNMDYKNSTSQNLWQDEPRLNMPMYVKSTHVGDASVFNVQVDRSKYGEMDLGVVLHGVPPEGPRWLQINRIKPGLIIDRLNRSMWLEPYTLHAGDLIIRVNHVTDNIQLMTQELSTICKLQITIRRTVCEDNSFVSCGEGPTVVRDIGSNNGVGIMMEKPQSSFVPRHLKRCAELSRPQNIPLPTCFDASHGYNDGGSVSSASTGRGEGASTDGNFSVDRPAFSSLVPQHMPPPTTLSNRLAPRPERPLTFDVSLEKQAGANIGIQVVAMTNQFQCHLIVNSIVAGGKVDQWNSHVRPPFHVQSGDHIIKANGFEAKDQFTLMAKEFRLNSTKICFTVQRDSQGEMLLNEFGRHCASARMKDAWGTGYGCQIVEHPTVPIKSDLRMLCEQDE